MKTREKMRLYRDIRSYEKYGKNFIYMPRQDSEERGKMLKNRGGEGMREIFHLETTLFGCCGGKAGKLSVGDGENHCLRMMIFLLM